jgi:hypothetical protein
MKVYAQLHQSDIQHGEPDIGLLLYVRFLKLEKPLHQKSVCGEYEHYED